MSEKIVREPIAAARWQAETALVAMAKAVEELKLISIIALENKSYTDWNNIREIAKDINSSMLSLNARKEELLRRNT